MRLARLALDAALAVEGVLSVDAGPLGMHVTKGGSSLVRGVRVAAEPGGRYSVEVGLRARMVALPALADTVRDRVARSAGLAGAGDQLGAIDVTFHDVEDAAAGLAAPSGPG
jgi:hypothetical protein